MVSVPGQKSLITRSDYVNNKLHNPGHHPGRRDEITYQPLETSGDAGDTHPPPQTATTEVPIVILLLFFKVICK